MTLNEQYRRWRDTCPIDELIGYQAPTPHQDGLAFEDRRTPDTEGDTTHDAATSSDRAGAGRAGAIPPQ